VVPPAGGALATYAEVLLSGTTTIVDMYARADDVRPEGANHQWRRNPPGELSIDPVATSGLCG
jgi:hypothetical protein